MKRIGAEFYCRDVLEVAPGLIGKWLVRVMGDGSVIKSRITEVEAYRGEEDLACHARTGRTTRTEVMYHEGGHLYVYLIYGMYWMLNIVTAEADVPQAVLVRGLQDVAGPGRLTRYLNIDKSFYGVNLADSPLIWLEEDGKNFDFETTPRIGVDYAGDFWKSKQWRYISKSQMA